MKWLAERYLNWRGWEFTGELPDLPKFMILGVPHTTNWDFIVFLAVLHHYDIKATFIGKHSWFRWPSGYFFRSWGGIPVDKSRPGGVIRQVVDALDRADQMILVIAPEGTRKAIPYWKGGFLHIAERAGIPIVLGYVDWATKRTGMGPLIESGGDPATFMAEAREFYEDKQGRHPLGKGPIRLRSESK